MLWLLLFCLSLVASPAWAQSTYAGAPGSSPVSYGEPDLVGQDVFICLVPDTQSQTTCDAFIGSAGYDTCATGTFDGACQGDFCTSSVYCKDSWFKTGQRILRNQVYALTNQWNKVDWTGITGPDPVGQTYLDPQSPKCDVILSLGDMMNADDAFVGELPDYAALDTRTRRSADNISDFWTTIKASGIPFLPVVGNHDPELVYIRLMTTILNFSSLPFYYTHHSGGRQYAIKFNTAVGPMCAIGMNSASTLGTAYNEDLSERDWINARIDDGCGDGLPIILIQHEACCNGTSLWTDPDAAVDGDANGYVWAVVGGHYTGGDGASSFLNAIGTSTGIPTLRLFRNYQQAGRHPQTTNPPYGPTCQDGAGGAFSVIRLQPQKDKVSVTFVNPYWNDEEAGATYDAVPVTFTFDWFARFPP